MSRAVAISGIDNPRLVRLARILPESTFGFWMSSLASLAIGGVGVISLAVEFSLFWLFLFSPWLVLFVVGGYGFVATFSTEWTHEQSYYTTAYAIFDSIKDPVDRDAGKALMQGIWDHEQTYSDRTDHNDSYYTKACLSCTKRKELLKELVKAGSPSNNNADIKMVEDHIRIKREVMKELGM